MMMRSQKKTRRLSENRRQDKNACSFSLNKLDGKVQLKIGKILLYIVYVFVILAGCFAFYKTQVYFYLFNTGNWKMAAENVVISYLEYTGITAGICGIYHLVKNN